MAGRHSVRGRRRAAHAQARHAAVVAADAGEAAFAVCGRQILPEQLTLSQEATGLCTSCLAAHTSDKAVSP